MDRRTALHRVALLLGGTLSSSVVSGVLAGCRAETGAFTPQTLTADQYERVGVVTDLIIPTTDTPGARAAGVPAFVDRMLTRVYTDDERTRFLAGLDDLDARAQTAGERSFLAASEEVQTAILSALEAAARDTPANASTPFFRHLKELTLVGYYTSEIGASQELRYVHVAGSYDGDVPFAEVGRAYS